MAQILCATDFSAAGNNAIDYACKLATLLGVEVHIVHSFVFPITFSEVPMPQNLMAEAQTDAENHLEKMVGDVRSRFQSAKVTGSVLYGDVLAAIEEFTEEHGHPMLVVIGSDPDDHGGWPESTLIDALKQIKYPVLAVPRDQEYVPIRKMCFAYDNKPVSPAILDQLTEIKTMLNAELHVFTADEDGMNRDNLTNVNDDVRMALERLSPKYHYVYDVDINKAVTEYCKSHSIDWLVLLPRKHSFFEGLFHKSHTKSIAYQSSVPILALHDRA